MAEFPNVIQTRRNVNLAGVKSKRDTFSFELEKQSLADIAAWGVDILIDNVDEQATIKNKPTLVYIDKSKSKPIKDFKKRGVINFGGEIQRALIRITEIELRKAILRATEVDTGDLSDVGVTWQWYFFDESGTSKRVNPMSIKTLSGKQRLALIPDLEYAGHANSKAYQERGIGFLGDSAKRLRRKTAFKGGFTVYAHIFRGDSNPIPALFIRGLT